MYKIFGEHLIEKNTIEQMDGAFTTPGLEIHSGALMPDAHWCAGGLPVGGVLAVKNAIIPNVVGPDIGCSMKITVFDSTWLQSPEMVERLKQVLLNHTRFNRAEFNKPKNHHVMDENWNVLGASKDYAHKQLGTSGGGNHFVEFGIYDDKYLALLSHSGSRGTGYKVAQYFCNRAKEQHPEGGDLAWLNMDTVEGNDYFLAMQLMGKYAEANHDCIHQSIAQDLGLKTKLTVFNTHNLAWKEDGLMVHRKGATPAHVGTMGIIPGTMADPAYVVEGLGNPEALNSASHGAGRVLGRMAAKRSLDPATVKEYLTVRGVELIGADLDEAPQAYKNIHEVMLAQETLVKKVGAFQPWVVRMAD